MDLPLADEIREARRLAEESRDAALLSQRLVSALSLVDILQRQGDALDADHVQLPGDDLIGDLSERWEPLADLASQGPRPTQSLRERLRLRRQQLEAARQFLAPLAREAHRRDDEMTDLQHRQSHLLEDPKYRDEVLEITAISSERAELGYKLGPISHRLEALAPTRKVVATFAERLDWVTRERIDLPGGTEWRAALVARDLVTALGYVLDQYGLEMQRPLPVQVPERPDPDPERSAALLAQVTGFREALVELTTVLEAEQAKLLAEGAILQQRYDELGRQLQDRMG